MIVGLIVSLINYFKLKKTLKKCLLVDNNECSDSFEYKGNSYDRERFIELEVKQIIAGNPKKATLQKILNEYEDELPKSKTPDIDKAFIEAYKKAIETM